MSDIKLFRVAENGVRILNGTSVSVEKTLQTTIERNLEEFLGMRFVASEYSTGKTHGGRIDTLGLDENGCPVIIEYKRAMNENVINQGLFYLDWLMDHQAEFTLLVMKRYGKELADVIEWASPRLLCIAGDFTKYDEYAVQQINRNVELIRYRRYDEGLLLLELVNSVAGSAVDTPTVGHQGAKEKTVSDYLASSGKDLRELFDNVQAFLAALGDDVRVSVLKNYIAFKRFGNFVCLEIHPQTGKILAYAKVGVDTVPIEKGFTRDVRTIGHFGTGDLEITIKTEADFERAKPFFVNAYEGS